MQNNVKGTLQLVEKLNQKHIMFEIVLFGIISRILYDREKKLQIQ